VSGFFSVLYSSPKPMKEWINMVLFSCGWPVAAISRSSFLAPRVRVRGLLRIDLEKRKLLRQLQAPGFQFGGEDSR